MKETVNRETVERLISVTQRIGAAHKILEGGFDGNILTRQCEELLRHSRRCERLARDIDEVATGIAALSRSLRTVNETVKSNIMDAALAEINEARLLFDTAGETE